MKIISKVILSISLVVFFNIIVFVMIMNVSEEQIHTQVEKDFIDSSFKLFKNVKAMEERVAHTVSSILAKHPKIVEGYLKDDRSLIINQTQEIWNNLKEQDSIIYEIHYFKPLGESFVNFNNLYKYGQDVTKIRGDVVSTFKAQTHSEHFWICSSYPGTRSTYPIKKDGKTLGVISVGLHLLNYSLLLSNSLNIKNMLVYKDEILKDRLRPNVYEEFLKDKVKINDLVVDSQFAKEFTTAMTSIDFTKNDQRFNIGSDKFILSSIPLKDKSRVVNGYLLQIKPLHISEDNQNLMDLIIYIILIESLLIIIATYIYLSRDVRRVYKLIELLKNISKGNFSVLDDFSLSDDKNEFSVLENHTVEMGRKLSLKFNKFSSDIEKFQFESEHDALTGLLNRRTLNELGRKTFEEITGDNYSVIMLDIDYFKEINDKYGHVQGDIVLKQVALVLLSQVRRDDLVFRYGGEEFCIILRETAIEQGIIIAEKIRIAIVSLDIYVNEKERLNITISGGLTESVAEHKNINDLIKTADKLLYKAKKSGRDKIVYEA